MNWRDNEFMLDVLANIFGYGVFLAGSAMLALAIYGAIRLLI